LFAVYAYVDRGRVDGSDTKIVLTADDLAQIVVLFKTQWRRDPTPEEFGRMVETKVQEEVLYREGLAMGLDKDDTIVKRRMAQKLQCVAEDIAALREPSASELRAWYEKNSDKFQQPTRVSFRHLYFAPDKRGANAKNDAEAALVTIAGQREDTKIAAGLAGPFIVQGYFRDRGPEFLGKGVGPNIALAVAKLPPESRRGAAGAGRWRDRLFLAA